MPERIPKEGEEERRGGRGEVEHFKKVKQLEARSVCGLARSHREQDTLLGVECDCQIIEQHETSNKAFYKLLLYTFTDS